MTNIIRINKREMCRYAMTSYKPHLACFNCRKTFKRRLLHDIVGGYNKDAQETPPKCPECGNVMANMGLDFESPKKKDIKAWKYMATLFKVDITFHSCGCSGPGYIPSNTEQLISHFMEIKDIYLEHQHFWARRRADPESQSEIARDKHYNGSFLYKLPNHMINGTKNKPRYNAAEAQIYWHKKINEIQQKIEFLKINAINK